MKLNTEPLTPQSPFWQQTEVLAREAFPPEEYLAPQKLAEMACGDDFDFWALLDEDRYVGFMAVQTYGDMAYLFFLAIAPACRGRGYGSRALATLRLLYPGKKQVVDFERPDRPAANQAQRQRRKEFYLRGGYRETGLFLSYLGVEYEVMCMEENFDPEEFKALMRHIRVEGFDPVYATD